MAEETKKGQVAEFRTAGHLVGSEVLDALGSKGAPKRAMHQPLRASDDDVMERRIAPGENVSISFEVDPELGDAAAELADDLARSFIDAATGDMDVGEAIEETSGMDEATSGFEEASTYVEDSTSFLDELSLEAEEREHPHGDDDEDEPVWTPRPATIREMSRRTHAPNR